MVLVNQVYELDDRGLDAAAEAVREGHAVVMPTDTVYGIGADPFSEDAVQRLLDAKQRGRDMPPPLLIAERSVMRALVSTVPDGARELAAAFWPGPLTLILDAQKSVGLHLGETRGTVALRVPDHDGTRELLRRTGPLAVSSANISGQEASTDCPGAQAQLGDTVAVYLDGGPTPGSQPSTIVDFSDGAEGLVLRAGVLDLERLREVVPGIKEHQPPAPAEDAAVQEPQPEESAEPTDDDPTSMPDA